MKLNTLIKLGAAFAFVLIVGAGFFVVSNDSKDQNIEESNLQFETGNKISTRVTEKDSDKDGLKDWEETLWKTDIYNADTDGDGTKDGQEVAENRDPNKQGPGDEIEAEKIVRDYQPIDPSFYTLTRASYSPSGSSNSASAGQAFIENYVRKKLENGEDPLNYQDTNEIYNTLFGQLEHVKREPNYKLTDLSLINEETERDGEYFSQLEKIISDKMDDRAGEEIFILLEAMYAGDAELAYSTQSIALAYKSVTESLRILPTPTKVANEHLALLNAADQLGTGIDDLLASENDLVGDMIRFNLQATATKEFARNFRLIESKLSINESII